MKKKLCNSPVSEQLTFMHSNKSDRSELCMVGLLPYIFEWENNTVFLLL